MFRWILILVFCISCSQAYAQHNSWNRDSMLVSLIEQQHFAEAIPLIKNYISEHPNDLDAQVQLAHLYQVSGQTAQARNSWELVLQADSVHQNALYQLSRMYQNAEDYLKAEAYTDRLVFLYPDHAHYLKTKAGIKSQLNKSLEAFDSYAKAYKLNPTDLDIIIALANIFHNNKQYHESDSLITLGLSLDPQHFRLRKMQLEACYSLGYYAHTIGLLEEMRESPYFNNYFRRMLAICYIQEQKYEEALSVLQTIEEPDQNEEYTFYYLSRAYQGIGNKVLARHYIQKTLETCQHPNEGKYLAVLGNILIEAELYTLAAAAFEQSYYLQNDPMLLYWAARSYDAGEKYDKAEFNYFTFMRNSAELTDTVTVRFVEERLNTLKRKK